MNPELETAIERMIDAKAGFLQIARMQEEASRHAVNTTKQLEAATDALQQRRRHVERLIAREAGELGA